MLVLEHEQISESTCRSKVFDDLGKAHEVFLWNGKQASKKKFLERLARPQEGGRCHAKLEQIAPARAGRRAGVLGFGHLQQMPADQHRCCRSSAGDQVGVVQADDGGK
jgi:hypothetical protein